MTTKIDIVPKWIRLFLTMFAIANIVYGVVGYIYVSALFHIDATGVNLAETGAKYASFEFAARNLAIGIALLIVSIKGVPESIAIVTIIRGLIELQTIIIAVISGGIDFGITIAVVFLGLEIYIIRTMIKVISARDSHINRSK